MASLVLNNKSLEVLEVEQNNLLKKNQDCYTGKIIVNGKPATEYLKRAILDVIVNQPFAKTGTEGRFDINCTVLGGGLSGQAGAIKHAISIALQLLNPELRTVLKSAGFLTRDSRVVERKKAGLKKARKGQVYQRR